MRLNFVELTKYEVSRIARNTKIDIQERQSVDSIKRAIAWHIEAFNLFKGGCKRMYHIRKVKELVKTLKPKWNRVFLQWVHSELACKTCGGHGKLRPVVPHMGLVTCKKCKGCGQCT